MLAAEQIRNDFRHALRNQLFVITDEDNDRRMVTVHRAKGQ